MKPIQFSNLFASELYKAKKSIGLFLLFIFPVFVTGFVFYVMYGRCAAFETAGSFFWMEFADLYSMTYKFLYPLTIAIAVSAFLSLEHKAKGFSFLFTLPVKKQMLFFTKVALLSLYLLFSFMFSYALFVISGNLLSLFFPQMDIAAYNYRNLINMFFLRSFFSMMAVLILQLFLSVVFCNFVIPLFVALLGTTVCLFAHGWKYSFLLPYGGIGQAMEWFYLEDTFFLHKEIVAAFIYVVVFYFLGMFCFHTKKNISNL